MNLTNQFSVEHGRPSSEVYLPGVTPLVQHAIYSLRLISRTFQGISDTSASPDKRPLALDGVELAARIDSNFEKAVLNLVSQRELSSVQDIAKLILDTFEQVNDGLKTEGFGTWRTWETKYHVPVDSIRVEFDKFCVEYFARITDPGCDPIEFAAWIEKTLNAQIHPFYDGCGRVARALSISILAQANCKWPLFSSRQEYFELIEQPLDIWVKEYRDRIALLDIVDRENHQKYLDRLERLQHPPELIELEQQAYLWAKRGHQGQVRDGERTALGEPVRYFEHLRSTTLVLLDELTPELINLPLVAQSALIVACMYHDLPEDTSTFGNRKLPPPIRDLSWRQVVAIRIDRFDPQRIFEAGSPLFLDKAPYGKLSQMVLGVTEPDKGELEAAGIFQTDPDYVEKKSKFTIGLVVQAGPAAFVIKGCDRVANFRTMQNLSAARVLKKIMETERYYLKSFEQHSAPETGGIFAPLIAKVTMLIQHELAQLKARPDVAALILARERQTNTK